MPWQADEAECRYQQEPSDDLTPEAIFERRWAFGVLETATERLRAEFMKAGKGEDFNVLEVFLSGEQHTAVDDQ